MSEPVLHTACAESEAALVAALGTRAIVLVGMMGAGKSSVGRRLAARLRLPFVDADTEIEVAAAMTIPEIFELHGEPHFRDGEARVIARLLAGGPLVLATGGGAFMRPDTRERIAAAGVSIWLKADADVIMRRVRRRADRPLLKTDDPAGTVARLIAERHPLYERADLVVDSREVPHEKVVEDCVMALQGVVAAGAGKRSVRAVAGLVAMSVNGRTIVDVALGDRAYEIVIGRGAIAELGSRIAALRPGARVAIVTDTTVATYWLAATEAALRDAGIEFSRIIVGEGESSKSSIVLASVCEQLIAAKIERNDLVVALGGGVVGDLAGFAAAILRRGVDFVQVPTSLLAQVDSSVGGKTGINSPQGKNLIGAFHQPILVIADTAVLDTLTPRQFCAGYAEVAKYGLLGDADFFQWLESNQPGISGGGEAREQAIAASCRAKAAIVARDERETGERALLNLGHTFGHALEAATGFSDRLFHGEGVSVGMVLAAEFSAARGMIPDDDATRIRRHLANAGLPVRLQDIAGFQQEGLADADRLLDLMGQDKKVKRGKLTFILLEAIGRAAIVNDVPPDEVRAFLAGKLAAET